ncbi:MAG: glycerol-3-phosphate 1-O-acyltransferase PlsY [Chloroflexota bacterium]
MSGIAGAIVVILLGYLLGAIPVGLIIGRLTRGIDIREFGSHRTGATNALRTLGARTAATVFALDLAKGAVAVVLAYVLYAAGPPGSAPWVAAAAGFAAVVGHIWSVFIRFTGGRGVATSTGALLALAPLAVLILAPIVVVVMWRWRYVSLGSVMGSLLAPLAVLVLAAVGAAPWAAVAYALAVGLLVTWAHRDNIARLRAGTERRIGQKEAAQ